MTVAIMIPLQLVIVGLIASVAADPPSTFGPWRQSEIEPEAFGVQQEDLGEWRNERKPEDTSLFHQAGKDLVFGEWRPDQPSVLIQDDVFGRVDEKIEDMVEVEARPPIDSYIGIGYDLIKGNPEGDFALGGVDPGLRLRSIFKLTDANEQPIPSNSPSLPIQIEYTPVHACSSVNIVNAFSGTKSYQKKLDVNVDVEGGGNYGLFNFRFSLSAGYSSAKQSTTGKREVMIDTEVVCNVGRGRYLLDTAFNNEYSISTDFYYSVKNLPADYNSQTYMNFLRRWGTHIIVEADFGGRQIQRYKYTYAQMYDYASTHVSGSVSVGGSYGGFSGSLSVDINSFNSHVSKSSSFSGFQYTVNSGSTIVKTSGGFYEVPANDAKPPIPIAMKLRSIILALDPRLWTALPENGQTYATLNIARKKRNLERALTDYPRASRALTSDDPSVTIPNAWPNGAYSLPKPRSGCPSDGGQFSWHTGWRYQDTEDDNNINAFSSSLAGTYNNNIETEFCTKTDTTKDYGIKWPKGSYCIARKGGSCPAGFEDGWIYWDDEDSNNRNLASGILPDGAYNGNTKIYFCCRKDGFATNKIILPTDKPFYLYSLGSDGCQRVTGMSYRQDWIKWDCEDSNTSNNKGGLYPYVDDWHDIRLYYCYYY